MGVEPRWLHRRGGLSLARPLVMGILNATPDSFSGDGLYRDLDATLGRAVQMVEEGAGILDIGGESTRPGALPVAPDEEMDRIIPIIVALRKLVDVAISVDTRSAAVAHAALQAGADIVNDVSALTDPGMASVVAESGAGLVLMHMRGTPADMQNHPAYEDVAAEVTAELGDRLQEAVRKGIDPERVVVDPGIGFGKTLEHNLTLLAGLDVLSTLGRPILLGVSRKSFLGTLIGGAPASDRAVATAAACVAGLLHGARVFRVHDVRMVQEALQVAEAIRTAPRPKSR